MTRYAQEFSWDSTYGHVARLLERLGVPAGTVVDLGCGDAPIAETLAERGFDYVGIDVDLVALEAVRARGVEAHHVNLRDIDGLPDELARVVGERQVRAVLLLDTLEHLPETRPFLDALRQASERWGRPLLLLSVPNVAHFDVGMKLLMGRWDVTETGLLDATHVQHFTLDRLTRELGAFGWSEVADDDLELYHSDQHFPVDHPTLVDYSPFHDLAMSLRREADSTASINQFVRAYQAGDPQPAPPAASPPSFALTVLLRTQGARLGQLEEALTCLGAQTTDDFEVLLLVHSPAQSVVDDVRAKVGQFASSLTDRVQVVQVVDGNRARPLNVGLDQARGRYLAVLDDDDLVTADWAEAFVAGATLVPGNVIRSITADRNIERPRDPRISAPYVTISGLEFPHGDRYDAIEHLHTNRSPVCSLAFPIAALRAFDMRFDESVEVLEDWEMLLRAASRCGVHDTGRVTSVYHRWAQGASSDAIAETVWTATRETILDRLDAAPLVLPRGTAHELSDLARAAYEQKIVRKPRSLRHVVREAIIAAKDSPAAYRVREKVRSNPTVREAGLRVLRRLQR